MADRKELINFVFRQDLLLEQILSSIIFKNDGTFNWRAISNLRLVQKSWLPTIMKLIRVKKQPLFTLRLDQFNSLLKSDFVAENGKLLNTFTQLVSRCTWYERSLPTFNLKIGPDFFKEENYESLISCLLIRGRGLLELDVCAPTSGGTLPTLLERLNCPRLRKLIVRLQNDVGGTEGQQNSNAKFTEFLQFLLNSSESLNEIRLARQANMVLPLGFEHLTLPSSITKLDIKWDLKNEHLNLLTRNQLPNLTDLTLLISTTPFEKELLKNVLETFSKQLKIFHVAGVLAKTEINESNITIIQFPVMEKLESLTINSSHLDLEPGISCVETCFPKLRELHLLRQRTTSFQNWTKRSRFSSVQHFTLQLVDETVVQFNDNLSSYLIGLDSEQIDIIKMSFPCIRKLEITVRCGEAEGLAHLFKKMRQLTDLKIVVIDSDHFDLEWESWDGLLIGASYEEMEDLENNPAIWKENDDTPSLRMMKELTTLTLETGLQRCRRCHEVRPPLISQLAFQFAFYKMPNLKDLYLRGRFRSPVSRRRNQQVENEELGLRIHQN